MLSHPQGLMLTLQNNNVQRLRELSVFYSEVAAYLFRNENFDWKTAVAACMMHFCGSGIDHTPPKERTWSPPNNCPWVGEIDDASRVGLLYLRQDCRYTGNCSL